MSIASLVEQYGYLAVFIGTFLEGETVLLVAGFAAHRQLLKLPNVMVLAFIASALGDQFYFFLGRHHGHRLLARFPALAGQAPRVKRLLAKYDTLLILSIRFLYGLRIAGPIVMGALEVSPFRFTVLNLIGAAIWAVLIAWLGYIFGSALEWLLQDIKRIEESVLVGILLAGALWSLFRFWRHCRGNR